MEEDEMEKMRIADRAGEVSALEFSSVPEVKKWTDEPGVVRATLG